MEMEKFSSREAAPEASQTLAGGVSHRNKVGKRTAPAGVVEARATMSSAPAGAKIPRGPIPVADATV
jgi:hypothetical protein